MGEGAPREAQGQKVATPELLRWGCVLGRAQRWGWPRGCWRAGIRKGRGHGSILQLTPGLRSLGLHWAKILPRSGPSPGPITLTCWSPSSLSFPAMWVTSQPCVPLSYCLPEAGDHAPLACAFSVSSQELELLLDVRVMSEARAEFVLGKESGKRRREKQGGPWTEATAWAMLLKAEGAGASGLPFSLTT